MKVCGKRFGVGRLMAYELELGVGARNSFKR